MPHCSICFVLQLVWESHKVRKVVAVYSNRDRQQLQQAQQGVNQNLNCPSGTQQINGQCQVINGLNSALNPLGSTAANTATCGSGFTLENGICTPTSATCTPSSTTQTQPVAVASPSSQTVTAGQLFVISGATSTGGTVLNSCVGVRFK